jgi:hypothetical protein
MRAEMALAFFVMACDAVPDVTYANGDAAPATDGGNSCPTEVPTYATSCCGPIACSGANCAAACDDCVATCALAELCCPNSQAHAICKASLQCP